MSRGRTYYGFSDMRKVNKLLGIKVGPPARAKKYDEQKRTAQRIKFCRCRVCGGMMTYATGTNSLICDNLVDKKITKTLRDGTQQEVTVKAPCQNVNLVGEEYREFLAYLFDGVPNNQAVLDVEAKRVTKEEE